MHVHVYTCVHVSTCGGVYGGKQRSLGVPVKVSRAVPSTEPDIVHHKGQVVESMRGIGGIGLQHHCLGNGKEGEEREGREEGGERGEGGEGGEREGREEGGERGEGGEREGREEGGERGEGGEREGREEGGVYSGSDES